MWIWTILIVFPMHSWLYGEDVTLTCSLNAYCSISQSSRRFQMVYTTNKPCQSVRVKRVNIWSKVYHYEVHIWRHDDSVGVLESRLKIDLRSSIEFPLHSNYDANKYTVWDIHMFIVLYCELEGINFGHPSARSGALLKNISILFC